MTADEPAHADPETLLARLKQLDAEATPVPWRAGRKVHRTLYGGYLDEHPDGELIGMLDYKEDTALVVELRNALPRLLAVVEAAEELERTVLQRHYPAEVFTGESGDIGPVIIRRFRDALAGLGEPG